MMTMLNRKNYRLKKGEKQKICFEDFVGQVYIFAKKSMYVCLQRLPKAWGIQIKDKT